MFQAIKSNPSETYQNDRQMCHGPEWRRRGEGETFESLQSRSLLGPSGPSRSLQRPPGASNVSKSLQAPRRRKGRGRTKIKQKTRKRNGKELKGDGHDKCFRRSTVTRVKHWFPGVQASGTRGREDFQANFRRSIKRTDFRAKFLPGGTLRKHKTGVTKRWGCREED